MQSLERGYPQPEQIYIYLARIEDTRGNYTEALAWLNTRLILGHLLLNLKYLTAELIAKYEGNDQAIESLDQYTNLTPEARLRIIQGKNIYFILLIIKKQKPMIS